MKDTMFLKSRKSGITVAMAVTMILIVALMTTTITIAVTKTVKGSNLKAFATELSLVQNTIQELAFSGSINEYLGDDVVLSVDTNSELFEGETVERGRIIVHVLDLSKMGIEKSIYGIGKNGNAKDYYAVSLDTMKVYYIAGYDSGDKVHYTLTDELTQVLNGENKATYKNNNILFKPNTVQWTNKPITVTVMVSTEVSTCTVSTNKSDISISDAVTNGGYYEYTVNTESIEGNYVITVNYTLKGSQRTETYTVSNFDNEAPTILMSSMQSNINNSIYLNNVRAVDNGKIKNVKYIEVDIADSEAKSFFATAGNDLIGEKVKLSSMDVEFTIYAEDYAGNYTTTIVTIPDKFYYVGGTRDTGLVISDKSADENKGVDYTCVGNQFVWVPVEYTATGVTDANGLDTGFTAVFKRGDANSTTNDMTGALSTNYTEPYASGYSTESAEYYAMCKSVQEYRGFYIARFEAGDGDVTSARTDTTTAHTVVSKKNAYVYNYVPWGTAMNNIEPGTINNVANVAGAVYLSQNMYKNHESVVSTLCYGVQWDATLNFVADDTHSITDSKSWGNYADSFGDATTNSGRSNMNYTTGRNEAWKAKNIYDIAGNIYEWTMESHSSDSRFCRGGYYVSSGSINPAANRSYSASSESRYFIGFRSTLYIKQTQNQVVIPKGFYYVGGTKDTGLVISDNSEDENIGVGENNVCVGNQFVWVPVDDYSKFVRGTAEETSSGSGIYKMTGTADANYSEPYTSNAWEVTEYNAMCASVNKYGGFYIARFEAGDGDVTTLRTSLTEAHTVVSKKGAIVYSYVPWGETMSSIAPYSTKNVANVAGAVYLSQNMYKNHESVVSTLCYGVQWDATMNFVSDAVHNITSASTWGNYVKNFDELSDYLAAENFTLTTGANELWKAKNIYDLSGNVDEWTMEVYDDEEEEITGRAVRGGSKLAYNIGSAYRDGDTVKNSSDGGFRGFRVALYLK